MKKINKLMREIIQLTTLSKSNYMVLYNSLDEILIAAYDKKEKLFAL